MNPLEYFWAFVLLFSVISFSYMSIKVVYKGFAELKEMFEQLMK